MTSALLDDLRSKLYSSFLSPIVRRNTTVSLPVGNLYTCKAHVIRNEIDFAPIIRVVEYNFYVCAHGLGS
jgi:hypothetical protein